MREILFRGKRIDNGEWVEGFYVCLFEKKDGFYQANHYIFDGNIRFGEETYTGHGNYYQEVIICKRKIDEKTLGQFTGMTDKNGNRIFEGDIAKVLQGKDKDIAYVGFENGAFMLYPRTGNIYERTLWSYWYNDWDVEVIGNITDNPELLEK